MTISKMYGTAVQKNEECQAIFLQKKSFSSSFSLPSKIIREIFLTNFLQKTSPYTWNASRKKRALHLPYSVTCRRAFSPFAETARFWICI